MKRRTLEERKENGEPGMPQDSRKRLASSMLRRTDARTSEDRQEGIELSYSIRLRWP
jgi:hypothetical protein